MSRWGLAIAGLSICLMTACSTPVPTYRAKSAALVDEVKQDAVAIFPQEYLNLLETFEHGEAVLLVQHDEQAADVFYQLALQKGSLLKKEMQRYKQRKAQQEQEKIAAEAARLKEEQLMLEAAQAEARLREQELRAAAQQAQAAAARVEAPKPPPQALSYTVRRGETLPQIAARTEIYNDSSLWPLIYRANRDQIRDPKQLWPGQVLKIPRHFSRDEALKAKRYSGKK